MEAGATEVAATGAATAVVTAEATVAAMGAVAMGAVDLACPLETGEMSPLFDLTFCGRAASPLHPISPYLGSPSGRSHWAMEIVQRTVSAEGAWETAV